MRIYARSLFTAAAVSTVGVAVTIALVIRGIGKSIDGIRWADDEPETETAWCKQCELHLARGGSLCPVCAPDPASIASVLEERFGIHLTDWQAKVYAQYSEQWRRDHAGRFDVAWIDA